MNPLERLLAEELPTGTELRGPAPAAPAATTKAQAAARRAAAVADAYRPRRRHLHAVPAESEAA